MKPGRAFRKVRTPKKFLASVRVVFVARKLGTTEEQRQNHNCLFWRGDYRSKTTIPKNGHGFELW
jgi:hypothetical protein